uniref:DDB1- and CUL4-associated factor 1-like n=1 Tax=Styela clava TaxID=7725 RepID=UPI0019399C2D|nr:DDB1- and CUL4-associated factor 1-like [Styela clava]
MENTTTSARDAEKQFSELVEAWKSNHESSDYDPVPFLTDCAKLFEEETIEFHKGDPDPFDERHPEYAQPGCVFGKLLVSLSKSHDFMDKLTSSYFRVTTNPKNPSQITLAAARFLLAALPGLEPHTLFKEKEWLIKLLSEWVTDADEPLRTYATGLLVGAIEPQKTSNDEYIRMISILLKRLWNHVRPGKFPESECDGSTFKVDSSIGVMTSSQSRSQKRKLSNSSDAPKLKRIFSEKPHTSTHSPAPNGEMHFTSDYYDNDLSNSSWSEQMPAMIGCSYSLEPPLHSEVCQRFILDFLKCLGEYQDLLSIFLELKALELINIYIKEKKFDGLLIFKALEFLASLLCHNKVATEFIELNGIQNLLSVQRPSMGSTGVSLCIYYLAYKKDAMERACQLPARILSDLVKYALWLLECSHETGRSHAALFFSFSFSFRVILQLFDKMSGLRCLMNMISMSKIIINVLDDNYDPDEDANRLFMRQTTRTVCAALKKYFEAHLQIKVCSAQKSIPKSKERHTIVESVSKYKPMVSSREQFFENLEVLGEISVTDASFRSMSNWLPVLNFYRLDGIALMVKVIDIACDWVTYTGQIEVIRSALDVLAVVTLLPSPQLTLCKHHTLNKKFTGISIMLDIAKGGTLFAVEGETQKSALAVIVNCVRDYATDHRKSTPGPQDTPRSKPSQSKTEKREMVWKYVQYNNGISVLLSLLVINQPALHADEVRYFACKALLGLSNYKPIAQIMSKLPFFIGGQVQSVAREPVLHYKKRLHTKFCKCMGALLEKVSGRPMNLELDLDAIRISHIVSETHMQYENKEVLQMIHNHLVWSKLPNAAEILARDACLFADNQKSILSTPKSRPRAASSGISEHRNNGSGDASSSVNRRISFTRGSHALGDTPTSSHIINIPNQSTSRRHLKGKSDPLSAYNGSNGQQRFKLSQNGIVSVKPKPLICRSKEPPSPPTLNSIIEENFKHQHARCRNPVATVPEFSLFSQHRCPDPRYRVEASTNVMKRLVSREGICPRWGGIGGEVCDRQLVYSRYKPGYVFKGSEDRKVPFCSVAFMPGDEQIVLGDYQGDVVIHNLYSAEDQVIQGVAGMPISALQPSRNGDSILVTAESIWANNCSLHSLGTQLEHKFTFEDIDHAEFSKLHQDKIIGTKEHKATVYDLNTGSALDTFEREDMCCYYKENRATFSPDDKLILSDGLLWDVRKPHTLPIHKFDQFNTTISGVFHPNGLQVVINSEVWDLRNYHLLHTIPALDQCNLTFNSGGTIIYAVRTKDTYTSEEQNINKSLMSAFRTFDALEYKQLAFNAVRHQIYDLAVDSKDCSVAIVETLAQDEEWREPAMSVCRFYEVGMTRGDEDDEDVESHFDDEDNDSDGDGSSISGSSNGDDGSSQGEDHDLDRLSDMLRDDNDNSSGDDISFDIIDSSSDWQTTDDEEWAA